MVVAFILVGCGPEASLDAQMPARDVAAEPIETETFELMFSSPPSSLPVGETVALSVHALEGGEPAQHGMVSFESTTPRFLSVDASGQAKGLTTGTAFVRARTKRGEALVEIEIVTP